MKIGNSEDHCVVAHNYKGHSFFLNKGNYKDQWRVHELSIERNGLTFPEIVEELGSEWAIKLITCGAFNYLGRTRIVEVSGVIWRDLYLFDEGYLGLLKQTPAFFEAMNFEF